MGASVNIWHYYATLAWVVAWTGDGGGAVIGIVAWVIAHNVAEYRRDKEQSAV
jgi:hypothetical protein